MDSKHELHRRPLPTDQSLGLWASGQHSPGQFPANALADLVHHRRSIDAQTSLADAQKIFQDSPEDFFAITAQGRVRGLCSRASVAFMLGSRYGFALYGSHSVMSARAHHPLIYKPTTPLPLVLDEALSRAGSDFFEDIIIIDDDENLVGLVPVPRLARLQLHLFGEQIHRVVVQDQELRQHNLELFQINNQLRQSQGRYKALFENNALGVALLTPKGAIVAHNPRFEQLLSLCEGPPPQHFLLDRWLEPTDRATWFALLASHETNAPAIEPRVTELKFILPTGTHLFQLHTNWVTETGQICAFLEDITEQRSLEQRMAQQEKQGMLDTLVAGVAHELNNKLTPVLGFVELLESATAADLPDHTRCIRQSAQEAAQIVRQLLSLSRPDEDLYTDFDVNTVCRDVLQMLRFQLREANCETLTALSKPPLIVRGDAAQLKQVLINLILNALHAMESVPSPKLALAARSENGFIWVKVRDNGTGIKPEIQRRIFDPFFTTKGPRGTGLGLSISASIIRQHGGELSVESVPGEGATFLIKLPASTGAETALLHQARVASPAIHAPAIRRRALIIDDEEYVRHYMQEALRQGFGCNIETAVDGAEAINKLEQGHYDLIVSDIRMPRIDGLQLRSWVAGNRAELSERMIFVTGHAGAGGLDQAISQLGCQIIRKPFTLAAIQAACRPYLMG